MICSLYHKNIKVIDLEYDSVSNHFGQISKIYNENHLPIGVKNINGYNLSQGLTFWWNNRLIPKNRFTLQLQKAIKNSHGFNLSDHYWIKAIDDPITWEKGNFFTNSFTEDIGKYIIERNTILLNNMFSDSPDFFSNGEQDKRWVIDRGFRKLLKYGKPPYYEQPFNEMLATETCRRLKFPHVKYSFVVKDKTEPIIYSACHCFIDENTEFIPASFIQYVNKKDKNESSYNHLLHCCKTIGMNNLEEIEQNISKMVLLDYVMANTDRHFGNFGFIRNVNTLEWKGVAPFFDTGNAMFYDCSTSDLRKSTIITDNIKSKSFASTQKLTIQKFANSISKLNLNFSALNGIDKYYDNLCQMNPKCDFERKELLVNLLHQRTEQAQYIVYSKNDIVKDFLLKLNNNTSENDFFTKLAITRNEFLKLGSIQKSLIDNYIRSLKPSDSNDLKTKILKDMKKLEKTHLKNLM